MKKVLKVLDLFSGIGGFSLGLERAGMETIAFCEIERYPVSILRKHWPDVPIHRDIRNLDGRQYYNKIDVLCGGFPCQPFSVAGKQAGKKDNRHLWPEMLRIIKESKPTWVIGENVTGFIKMALDDVLLDLETEGYTTQSFVIPACAVGGIHRRDRIWILAYSDKIANGKQYQYEASSQSNNGKAEVYGIYSNSEHDGRYGSQNGQSNSAGNVQDTPGEKQAVELKGSSCSRGDDANAKFSRPEQFRPIGIPTEPPVRSRDDGLSENVARLKALGNAVVPHIPELIGRAILSLKEVNKK